MSGSAANADEQLSFEAARAALEQVVRTLESGTPTLEEALALWERGEVLAGVCERWLDGAQARLDTAEDTEVGAADTD